VQVKPLVLTMLLALALLTAVALIYLSGSL
jgi:hypothetical protein